MTFSRRDFLYGGAALTLLTAGMYGLSKRFESAPDEEAILDAWRGRFIYPLRLPGQYGLFSTVQAKTLSRLTARPVSLALRGGRHSSALWLYQTEVNGNAVYNPILLARPGDRLSFSFENQLPQPTIVHWHGFTNDTRNDGSGMTLAEPGKSYQYDWIVRNDAGLNWYHPHPHQNAGEHTWRGLSGLFLVEDDASDYVARELKLTFGVTDIPLVIQDRTIERNGSMEYSDNSKRKFHGMSGTDILVNLTRYPTVDLPRGWVRFRILNGSNARLYRLAFKQKNNTLPFMLLGADSGLLSTPIEMKDIFLAPAQRLDVAVDLRQADIGDVWLKTLQFDPMHNEMGGMSEMPGMNSMGAVHTHGARGEGADEPILRINVKPYDGPSGRLPTQITGAKAVSESATVRDFFLDHDGDGHWRINGKSFHSIGLASAGGGTHEIQSVASKKTPAITNEKQLFDQTHRAFQIKRNTRETWVIRNDSASMPHPMHLHGFSFTVLSRKDSPKQLIPLVVDSQGRTAHDLARLDTVLVWPGETVRIAVDFSHPFPNEQSYMFHCHNLEHEDNGMMLGFVVT
ncbi:MAG: multicopper oxidase domain-containing protein [Pseudomonadota bacterium]